MMRKIKPRVFTEEERALLKNQSVTQEVQTGTPKSADPKNYPVFSMAEYAGKKVLIYVPKHIVVKDGVEQLRMDTPLIHSLIEGKRFPSYRCISGLSEELGYSGSCPLCDGTSDSWDLANALISSRCEKMNLDPQDKENDQVKSIRSTAYSARVVKQAERYYTFPIVVIETEEGNTKKIVKDENGGLIATPMWYSVKESAYETKWLSSLESLEDEPTHPGGYFFILNYENIGKDEKNKVRDAAKNLVVSPKVLNNFGAVAESLDTLTEGWDEIKCQETVIANMYYSEEDLSELCDNVLLSTRNQLALLDSSVKLVDSESESGFELFKKPDDEDSTLASPVESDLDME